MGTCLQSQRLSLLSRQEADSYGAEEGAESFTA